MQNCLDIAVGFFFKSQVSSYNKIERKNIQNCLNIAVGFF